MQSLERLIRARRTGLGRELFHQGLRLLADERLFIEDVELDRLVVGSLGAFHLGRIPLEDPVLYDTPALRVDGMSDVRMQLQATGGIAVVLFRMEPAAAVVAVAGAVVVLPAATGTALAQLTAGHGHERTLRALDDLQVPDHEIVVDRDAAECPQLVAGHGHELDPHLGYFHRQCSFREVGTLISLLD
jgi:hypothetical protein